MKKQYSIKLFFVLMIGLFSLSGCSVMEPRISKEYKVRTGSMEEGFQCAEKSIDVISTEQPNWESKVTKKDTSNKVFETGDFQEWNKMGFRVKINFYEDSIIIDLKGSGPYLTDIGVEQALNGFAPLIVNCLNK